MNVIVLDSEAYARLKYELFQEMKNSVKVAFEEIGEARTSDWISQEEARKLLNYSSRTSWQKLRDSGKIIWSKEGRLIQYSRKSIESYIEKNRMV